MSVFVSRPLWALIIQVQCADSNSFSIISGSVVGAIQSNPSLPFDMDRLKDFVQLDEGSWERHGAWVKELGNLLAEA